MTRWLVSRWRRFQLWYFMRNLRRIDNGGYNAWGVLGFVLVVYERSLAAIVDGVRQEKRIVLQDFYSKEFYGIKWLNGVRINPKFIEREFDPVMDRYWRRKAGDNAAEPAEVKNMAHEILGDINILGVSEDSGNREAA